MPCLPPMTLPADSLLCALSYPRSCGPPLAAGKKGTVQCVSVSESLEACEGKETLPGSDSLLQHGKGALAEIQTSQGQSQEVRESAHILCTSYKIPDYFFEGCHHYKMPVIILW